VLRTLSLCTCRRQYPGAATGCRLRSYHPAISAFPDPPVGSACTASISRIARRSLALRPVHSRRPPIRGPLSEGFSHLVASMTAPVASGWSDWPGGACTHWKSAALSRRTVEPDIMEISATGRLGPKEPSTRAWGRSANELTTATASTIPPSRLKPVTRLRAESGRPCPGADAQRFDYRGLRRQSSIRASRSDFSTPSVCPEEPKCRKARPWKSRRPPGVGATLTQPLAQAEFLQ
jgi:hypothetical protein